MKYRKDINGLRAIAVLSVALFHFFPKLFPGGFIGVDVFFVISGYLMTSIILSRLHQGAFTLSQFYASRVERIVPTSSSC
ncbi:O-antigen acetylase [Vibrio variabilis]|uniref:O-antigen acetylase n=1 Tax=Vibrio variabilis TaxID=990271 RepID=A0ABQ0JDA5_9VIBR|nr:O-antigen acetylase [Vibrio variabilis]